MALTVVYVFMICTVHMVGGDRMSALGEWKLNNSKEFLTLQEEHAKLIEKTQSLEAENKHYLSQLNQVLTEKDGLSKLELEQRDRMLQQERAQSGEAQEAHTREQLETKNRHLEQQLEQMTQQMNQYSMKLNRAKEVCFLCWILFTAFLNWPHYNNRSVLTLLGCSRISFYSSLSSRTL